MFKEGHYILSGEVNSGKSTTVWKQYKIWSEEGRDVSGWISLPNIVKGEKAGYDIVILKGSAESVRQKFIRPYPFKDAFNWRQFWFDDSIFKLVSEMDFGDADVFVIDEIGPLELEDKLGFYNLLPKLYERYENTITVVRTTCLEAFWTIFHGHKLWSIEKGR